MDGKPSLDITAALERGYQLIDVSDRQEAKEFIEAWLPFNQPEDKPSCINLGALCIFFGAI